MTAPSSPTARRAAVIGEAIRTTMQEAGLNQSSLARRLSRERGMEQTHIGRWIRGEVEPSLDKLMALARGIGRPIAFEHDGASVRISPTEPDAAPYSDSGNEP